MQKLKYSSIFSLVIVASLFLLSACSSVSQPNGGVPSTQEPTNPTGSDRSVTINKIEIVERPSVPVQVIAKVNGTLKSNCERVADIQQKLDGNTLHVTVSSENRDTECDSSKPFDFQRNIGLNVSGLKAGQYKVEINGMEANFELAKDNAVPEKNS